MEGACQTYTSSIQVNDIPGTGTAAAMLLASHLVKWGIVQGTASLPATAATGATPLHVEMHCYVRKVPIAPVCVSPLNPTELHHDNGRSWCARLGQTSPMP